MSTTTLRHYKTTLSYTSNERERRVREFKKSLRTRISRRRFKQSVRKTLGRLSLS